jgi:PleD family two-component response regulator
MTSSAGKGEMVPSTILLVDDSRFARIANERALSRAGYNIIAAEDGERASN